MAFPRNCIELEAAGYIRDNKAVCRGCCADVEWYITPTGSKMPINPMPELDSPAVSHWATCPAAPSFRKKKQPQPSFDFAGKEELNGG